MSCFIGGLQADIKHDVSGQRPRGVLEANWYAKVYENAANAKKAYYQSTMQKPRATFAPTPHRPHFNRNHAGRVPPAGNQTKTMLVL